MAYKMYSFIILYWKYSNVLCYNLGIFTFKSGKQFYGKQIYAIIYASKLWQVLGPSGIWHLAASLADETSA